jgi:glycolate oxidase iron-sulfur subunit
MAVGVETPSLDELRKCVHCGICLPQCPTYRVLGEEMDSPRGRIYLMRAAAEGRTALTDTFARHMDLCLGCRACETACPSGVAFGSLLEATRAQLQQRESARHGSVEGLIFALFPHPDRLGAMLRILRACQQSGLQALVRHTRVFEIFPAVAALEALLPVIPPAAPLQEFTPARGPRRGRVGLLTGCVQRHLFPTVNTDTARLLSLAGYEVVAPARQGCCGALDLHAGRTEAFRERARALTAAFPADLNLDGIVTNAAGCGSTLREYARWLPESAAAVRLAERARDVTELLVECDLPLGPLPLTVTYHDACHLAHGQRVRTPPRALLSRIPGLQLVALKDSDLCCGSAGVYNLLEPEMADRLLAMKLERIAETGARVVAAGNPGCALQIAKGARLRGLSVAVRHPVELLARAVEAGSMSDNRAALRGARGATGGGGAVGTLRPTAEADGRKDQAST